MSESNILQNNTSHTIIVYAVTVFVSVDFIIFIYFVVLFSRNPHSPSGLERAHFVSAWNIYESLPVSLLMQSIVRL